MWYSVVSRVSWLVIVKKTDKRKIKKQGIKKRLKDRYIYTHKTDENKPMAKTDGYSILSTNRKTTSSRDLGGNNLEAVPGNRYTNIPTTLAAP